MHLSHRVPRGLGLAMAALLVAAVAPAPAVAQQDHEAPILVPVQSESPSCPMRRIDRQLVRCHSLTGTGGLAPLWVPEL